VDSQYVCGAPRKLVVNRRIIRDFRWNIVSVDPVHHILYELPRSQERNEGIGEKEIGVRGENELTSCPVNADIFCDHLKEGNNIGIADPSVGFQRHLDESYGKTV
jgi:hypothetical protein